MKGLTPLLPRPAVVPYQPLIPGNTGSVGRLAVATDTPLHLVRPLGFSLESSRLKRAGLDYWPRLDLHLHDEIPPKPSGGRLVAFSSRSKTPYWDVGLGCGDYLLFGPEDNGLSAEIMEDADEVVSLPIREGERSLNLAMAVAIALFEALRRTDWGR